jgi:Uma2 family endonuclease
LPITLDNTGLLPADGPQRARFTRDQFHFLLDNALLPDDKQYELIDGAVFEKMGQKQPHPGLILRWLRALADVFGLDHVQSQLPIALSDDSEPEPDLAVLRRSSEYYLAQGDHPSASEIELIVEVSVSTVVFDTAVKADRYARSGIREYWAVDVAGRVLILHRNPTSDGYAHVAVFSEERTLSPLASPDASFKVADYLP